MLLVGLGIITGWLSKSILCINSWSVNSGLGTVLFSRELGHAFTLLNIYGPNSHRLDYWNILFGHGFHKVDKFIMGGYLNFSLGVSETWGPNALMDPLSDILVKILVDEGLLDIPSITLNPTWRNMRVGNDSVSKCLDRFIINEGTLRLALLTMQWIGEGGESDPHPIFLEFSFGQVKPPSPFKFNDNWLRHESYKQLIRGKWMSFDPTSSSSIVVQFSHNLKKVKEASITWASNHIKSNEAELLVLEEQLAFFSDYHPHGYFDDDHKYFFLDMSGKEN